MSPPATRLLLAALAAASLGAAAPRPSPVDPDANPAPDPDAMEEVARSAGAGPYASARAISHYLLARAAALAGDLSRAADELRLAVAYDPGSAELHAARAELLVLRGRVDAAQEEAARAVALDPEGRPAAAGHVLLGRILAARHDAKGALRELRAAMEIEAALRRDGEVADPAAWKVAGEVTAEGGDVDGAVRFLEDALARAGSDGGGLRELGRTLVDGKDPARAEPILRRAAEVDRDDADAWRLLATAREALHRPAAAREAWLALLGVDPDDADALLGLGRLALRDDDVAAGREWFDRALRAGDDGAEERLRIAFEWLDVRRPEEALRVARQGLAGAPEEARLRLAEGLALQALHRWEESAAALAAVPAGAGELWFSARAALADSLSRAGRDRDALAALDPALRARPGDPALVSARALVLARAGRAAEAAAELRAVLDDRARAVDGAARDDLLAALSDALARAGRDAEAVAVLRTAVAGQPRDEALHYALGAALDRAGRRDESVAEMRAVLALSPDHAEALNFIGYTYAEEGVRLDEAEALVRRALRLAPRSGHIIDSLGWVLYRRGDFPRAVEALEEASRISGPDAEILDHLGDAYRAADRTADAEASYRRALRSFVDETPAEQLSLRAALERKLAELGAPRRPVAREPRAGR